MTMRTSFLFATALLGACASDNLDPTGTWHVGIIPDPRPTDGCTMAYPDPETWVVADGSGGNYTMTGPTAAGAAVSAAIGCEATRCRMDVNEVRDFGGGIHLTTVRTYLLDDQDQITGSGSIQAASATASCTLHFTVQGRRD